MTVEPMSISEWAERSMRIGKTEASRWRGEPLPWIKDALAALNSPEAVMLRPLPPKARRAFGANEELHRLWGESAAADPPLQIVQASSDGKKPIPVVFGSPGLGDRAWAASLALAAPRWTLGMFDAASDQVVIEKLYVGERQVWPNLDWLAPYGADYAADRVEWDVSGWGRDADTFFSGDFADQAVSMDARKAMSRKGLLCSTAVDRALSQNDGLNKVKSVRSTKPPNQVIRSLVVQSYAPPGTVVRKRGHGPA